MVTKKRIWIALALALAIMVFTSVPALATDVAPSGAGPGTQTPEDTENPLQTEEPTNPEADPVDETTLPEEGQNDRSELPESLQDQSLTPEGNLTLVDDLFDTNGRQLITVQTRSGAYYYIIIDRTDDGEQIVHFLNQVDDVDLAAILEETGGSSAVLPSQSCTCVQKCTSASTDPDCPVCAKDPSQCLGVLQPESEPPAETPQDLPQTQSPGWIRLAVLGGVAAAACVALLLWRRKKSKSVPEEQDMDEYVMEDDGDDDDIPENYEDSDGSGLTRDLEGPK